MKIKKLKKYAKLSESNISMILGFIVILIVGLFIIKNYNKQQTGETIPSIGTEENPETGLIYTVQKGDDLWKIADNFLGSGYEWKRIADTNDIPAPYNIEIGQELTIPPVISAVPSKQNAMEGTTPAVTVEPTETPIPTEIPSKEIVTTPTPTEVLSPSMETIQGDSYTVVKGDCLWNIAVRAYGDGFKWTEIAKVNNLQNPDLIHPGNEFVIPR